MFLEIAACDHDAKLPARCLEEDRPNPRLPVNVDALGWLLDEQHLGAALESPGDRQLLLISATEALSIRVDRAGGNRNVFDVAIGHLALSPDPSQACTSARTADPSAEREVV